MGQLQSSIQGFDNEVYLTETVPEIFRDAQAAAARVTSASGDLYTTVRTRTKRSLLTWLSQAPSMKIWEGERHVKENSGNEFTIAVNKYELTLGIDMDDLEDAAEVDNFSEEVRAAGESAGQHPDELMWNFLSTQGETAICYDGTPLIGTSHPLKDGSTYSNFTSGANPAWYLLDTAARAKGLIWQVRKDYTFQQLMAEDGGNVDGFMRDRHLYGVKARVAVAPGNPARIYKSEATLDEAGFEAAWTAMADFKGDAGRPIAVRPTVLMVPNALAFDAMKLLNTTLVNGGDTNHLRGMVEVVVNPYL